jgi:DHA1 family multidrug resistance protein-like MFS transporter
MASPTDASPDLTDPDAGQPGWSRTLYAVWFGQILALVGFSSRVPFLPFFLGDLGVPDVAGQTLWSGAINASGAAALAITSPLWGILADRYGRKPMLMRGLFGGALCVTLMGFATAPWQLLALRVLEGSMTGTVAAAAALVATSAPRHRMGYALGMVQTAVFAGAAGGPLLGGFIYDWVGPRVAFWLAGGMLFCGGLVVAVFAREHFTRVATETFQERESRWERLRASSAFLISAAMLTLFAAIFVVRMIAMAMQPIIPLFVEQLTPDNPDVATVAGIVLGAAGFTSALAAAYLGRLGDRIGHRRVLGASLVMSGLLYLPMAFVSSPWHLAVLQGMLGVAAGGLIPSANALVTHLTPHDRRGAIFGITAALSGLGGFVGPLLGAVVATVISFRATFVAAGILMLAISILVIWSVSVEQGRQRQRSPEPESG